MRHASYALMCLMVFPLWQVTFAAEPAEPTLEERAWEFVNQLDQGTFEKAVQRFDTVMTKALPPDKLQAIWKGLISQYGRFQRMADTRTEALNKYQIVFVTCQFERVKLDAKVVFTAQHEIAGLFFIPTGAYRVPEYVNLKSFDEVELTIGTGLWEAPGTLSLPKGEQAGAGCCVGAWVGPARS